MEAWSTKAGLDSCGVEDHVEEDKPQVQPPSQKRVFCNITFCQNSNSVLWNAMIAPLRQMSLTGFLWYQVPQPPLASLPVPGRGQHGVPAGPLQLHLPRPHRLLERGARTKGRMTTSIQEFSNPEATFGFVQLSTIQYGNNGLQYPLLRLHQTADYQTVPNPRYQTTRRCKNQCTRLPDYQTTRRGPTTEYYQTTRLPDY